ncbi:MAG: glycosyltransferase family 2 protein [Thermoplasmata archaeon]
MNRSAELSGTNPLVSVVIATFHRPGPLAHCIDSIRKGTYQNFEVVVVDDASDPETEALVTDQHQENIRYVRHARRTMTAQALNDGIRVSNGEIIVLTGDDNILDAGALAGFVHTFLQDPKVGWVGAVVYYLEQPDLIHSAGTFVTPVTRQLVTIAENTRDRGQLSSPYDVEIVDGCMAVRSSVLKITGLLDSERLPFYHETSSLQLVAGRAGYRIVIDPSIRAWHDLPITAGHERALRSPLRAYYMMRSRIFFERYYDTPLHKAVFGLFIPAYFLRNLLQVLFLNAPSKAKSDVALALVRGTADGLRGHSGITIF